MLMIFLMITLVACAGPAEREQKYLNKANQYFSADNLPKAKIEIKNVLQINPKNADARVLLGKISQQEGEYRQALMNFMTAAEEDKQQIEARLELAKIYLSANRDADASRYVAEITKIDPQNIEGKTLSAGLAMRSGDRETAIRLANEVLVKNPGNPQAISVLTAVYIDQDAPLALQKIDQGLEIDGHSIPLKLLKIDVLKRLDQTNAIADLYGELIKDHPKNLSFYDLLAASYVEQKNVAAAEKTIRKAIDINPDNVQPILALINFIQKSQSKDQAEIVIKEFMKKQPKSYELKIILANFYIDSGKNTEARSILHSVIDADPRGSQALNARVDLAKLDVKEHDLQHANLLLDEVFAIESANTAGRILSARIKIAENKMTDAITDLRTALKNDARSLEAYKLLAFAQEKDGTHDLALDSYFRALDIDHDDIASLLGAARLSIQNKQNDAAKKLLERALSLDSTQLEAILQLNQLLIADQQWVQAERLSQSLIDSDSVVKKATGYNALGTVLTAQKKWASAKEKYQQALVLSPQSYEPLAGIINSQLADNKRQDAIDFVKNHVQKFPSFSKANQLLASLYLQDKKPELAIEIYQSLILSESNNENLYAALASIYLQQRNFEKSEAIYQQGLNSIPDSVSLRIYLANLYAINKQYELSKNQYEIASRKKPDSQLIKNNLAILLVNNLPSEANTRQALELVADFSTSNDANYLDTLGWVQLHAGNTPQAISYLQRAVILKPSAELHYHLGMAYKKNGQIQEAKKALMLATQDTSGDVEWLETAKKEVASL
jgi:tetratricopeptide (TPR) repeat protein